MWKFIGKFFEDIYSQKSEEVRTAQRHKFTHDVVATEASVDPSQSARVGKTFRCTKLRFLGLSFCISKLDIEAELTRGGFIWAGLFFVAKDTSY